MYMNQKYGAKMGVDRTHCADRYEAIYNPKRYPIPTFIVLKTTDTSYIFLIGFIPRQITDVSQRHFNTSFCIFLFQLNQ